MSNMLDFILGYLFGVYSENSNKRMYEDEIKNSKYVPKFKKGKRKYRLY